MQKPSLQEKERATATAKTNSSATAKFGNIYGNGCYNATGSSRVVAFGVCKRSTYGEGFKDARAAEMSCDKKHGLIMEHELKKIELKKCIKKEKGSTIYNIIKLRYC